MGHQVLLPGAEAYDAVVREFGPQILDENGAINRRKLAAEAFDNEERLAKLNALVHPPVRERQRRLVEEFRARDPNGIAVVEAAILIETGAFRNFDRLIVVTCSEEQQIERAMHRDGYGREEAIARLRRQMPLAEKLKYADYAIDTSGSKEDTIKQVAEVYRSLRSVSI